uniref:30S ribosomal protein S11 n=1 Tax=Ascoseira mirabilis TaxID=76830 RepID=UPI0030027A6D|nr:30S ribosomal protein S11 [Ascoseira mirabilis]
MIKKIKRTIVTGIMHVKATFNNTIITISDLNGNTLSWASAGSVGFKGSRKSTPFASQRAADKAASIARDLYGLRRLEVVLRGSGPGREPSIRAVSQKGIRVISITDATYVPYNGCRPPKRRRV